jgi:hypothetical protein
MVHCITFFLHIVLSDLAMEKVDGKSAGSNYFEPLNRWQKKKTFAKGKQ